MKKGLLLIITLASLVAGGCGTMREVPVDEYLRSPDHGAWYAVLNDGRAAYHRT